MFQKQGVFDRPILTSSLALLFGFFVFSASLISASQEGLGAVQSASSKKLYFSTQLLPDHVLYPTLMAFDKVLVSITPQSQQKVFLYTDLAADRLSRAEKLLEKQEYELVITTLTKSQKYLLRAASEAFALPADQQNTELWKQLAARLMESQQKLQTIKQELHSQETSPLDALSAEIDALLPAITSRYSAE